MYQKKKMILVTIMVHRWHCQFNYFGENKKFFLQKNMHIFFQLDVMNQEDS